MRASCTFVHRRCLSSGAASRSARGHWPLRLHSVRFTFLTSSAGKAALTTSAALQQHICSFSYLQRSEIHGQRLYLPGCMKYIRSQNPQVQEECVLINLPPGSCDSITKCSSRRYLWDVQLKTFREIRNMNIDINTLEAHYKPTNQRKTWQKY